MSQIVCPVCGSLSSNLKFCSRSCANSHNNSISPKIKLKNKCKVCSAPIRSYWTYCEVCRQLKPKGGVKDQGKGRAKEKECPTCRTHFKEDRQYCSKKCVPAHWEGKYREFIVLWRNGSVSGGIKGASVSYRVRHYLFEKYSSKCSECNWSRVNPTTKKVPLHVDHIDGDWSNSSEQNLRLLCPNCHSLTPTYGALNKGRGRPDRRVKPKAEGGSPDLQTLSSPNDFPSRADP
jgi:predicted nucleic acid-binding Zn ribbon protein